MILTTWLLIIFFITLLIIGIITDEEFTISFSIIGIIATPLIGFWLMPNLIDDKIQIISINPSCVLKSETAVYVEFENFDTKIYKDKKSYDKIDSTSIFYLYKYYDTDGDLNSSSIEFKLINESDTIYLDKGIKNITNENN